MEGRDVFVVGAGNSACQAALHLARYARRVTMLVRGDSLERSMSDYLIREISATPASRCACAPRSATAMDPITSRRSPARQAARPDRAGPGGRAVRADRRRTSHAMATGGDSARARLHRDRPRRSGHSTGRRSRSKPPCPACSPPETPATARSNGSPRPSATARQWCASLTNTSPPVMQSNSHRHPPRDQPTAATLVAAADRPRLPEPGKASSRHPSRRRIGRSCARKEVPVPGHPWFPAPAGSGCLAGDNAAVPRPAGRQALRQADRTAAPAWGPGDVKGIGYDC
jgi:Pyridine nucleotide-disulphide oxidoreductase